MRMVVSMLASTDKDLFCVYVCVQVIATALHVIVNCVTAPPSLAYLLPPPGSAAGEPVIRIAVFFLGLPAFGLCLIQVLAATRRQPKAWASFLR